MSLSFFYKYFEIVKIKQILEYIIIKNIGHFMIYYLIVYYMGGNTL